MRQPDLDTSTREPDGRLAKREDNVLRTSERRDGVEDKTKRNFGDGWGCPAVDDTTGGSVREGPRSIKTSRNPLGVFYN
jgi:hypothetical protein